MCGGAVILVAAQIFEQGQSPHTRGNEVLPDTSHYSISLGTGKPARGESAKSIQIIDKRLIHKRLTGKE